MKKIQTRISAKIVLIAFITMMSVGSIIRVMFLIFTGDRFRAHLNDEFVFFGVLLSLFLTILIFTVLIDFFLVKRIKKIEKATINIKEGNYNINLDTYGSDEIASLSESFILMAEELKSNEYLNKEFVRNFSHEFKTPLSVIRGYAELLEQDDLNKDERKEYLEIIISETERLSHLTNNMLQISLIDSKAIINKDDVYSISEQIRNIIQMTQVKWEEKKLTFNLEMEEIKIKNNKELTYQIILNLLSNAIKYSNLKEQINITLKDTKDSFTFTISNKGQIIPKEDFDKVFNLFYIANKTNQEESTGVGLTLTKKIVDKLKGKITFDSYEGLTTFNVILAK